MNPSASGWIVKFGHEVKNHLDSYQDFRDLYGGMKKTGFVYGLNVKVPRFIESAHPLSEDEKAKINLITSLYFTFKSETGQTDYKSFLNSIFQFYTELGIFSMSFLNKLFTGRKTTSQLEKLMDSRVYLEDNLISKTFNSVITNSLLFIDVLTYKEYLNGREKIRKHAKNLEHIVINLIFHALSSKERNKKDDRLAQLFESSLTFIDSNKEKFDGRYREKLAKYASKWENRYFLDVACITVWEDKVLELHESEFIFGIGNDLGFERKHISRSLEEVTYFFEKNAPIISFLKSNNLAIQFYDSMSKVVNKLILRNSKRLQKELTDSKELVSLLSKSTVKDLTPEEKKKVQNQLIDIFKSIPSLAIFMLPGGAVLLPIFIKLIPKLLPSAFDDNRVENTP
ncbi:MAG: LETM1 domain-containing protein [Eudoraea sp.]|nr:LETM1 domain-containing protein [Eudoraea sp.]MBT8210434.1 LETM1 domain-containing protein [Eudoraea sp.]